MFQSASALEATMGKCTVLQTFMIAFLTSNVFGTEASVAKELVEFSKSNGFKAVNLVTIKKDLLKRETLEIIKSLLENEVQVKVLSISELVTIPYTIIKEDYFFTEVANLDDWLQILLLLSHIRVHSAVVINSWDFNDKTIPTNSLNVHTYLLQKNTLSWFEVIGVNKTQFGINRRLHMTEVNKLTSVARLNLDFQNITLNSMELDWEPLVLLSKCENISKHCHPDGISGDVVLEIAPLLNLTIIFTKEPTNDWGVMPSNGDITKKNSSWSGVMGSVISGESQISISCWMMLDNRHDIVDLALMDTEIPVVVLSLRQPEIDWSLLLRPLTNDAWKVILILIVLTLTCLRISHHINHGNSNAWSFRFANISGLFLWLMLNAFYSGAMTMFFSNKLAMPFNSLEEAMNAYPEWNLLMRVGSEIHYKPYISQSSSYAAFWKRVESKPDKILVQDDLEGLTRVARERAVLQLQKDIFLYMVNNKNLSNHDIAIAFRSRFLSHRSFMLTHNSPLTDAFSFCLLNLKEHGIIDRIKKKWQGPYKLTQKIASTSEMALTIGQMILIFLLMAAAVALALVILRVEIFFHQWDAGVCEETLSQPSNTDQQQG